MKYIRSFDGLRAVSIILVLLNHLGLNLILPKYAFVQQRVWALISGGTGVNIFFVLSGFLITRVLLAEMNARGSISLTRFYTRRVLRLLPALLVFYTIVTVLMYAGMIPASLTGFLASFFYVYNFVPPTAYVPELIHTWSLAVEEQFYFTWPLLLAVFRSKKAFYMGVALVGICLLAKLAFPFVRLTISGQAMSLTDYYRTELWFIPAVAPVMIGALGAILIDSHERLAEAVARYRGFWVLLAALLFASPLYIAGFLADTVYVFQSLGILLLLYALLEDRSSKLAKILSFGPLVYIGKISYGLYVFQGLFLRNGPGGQLLIQQFPVNITLTIACAVLSYHFIERPVLSLKEKYRPTYA